MSCYPRVPPSILHCIQQSCLLGLSYDSSSDFIFPILDNFEDYQSVILQDFPHIRIPIDFVKVCVESCVIGRIPELKYSFQHVISRTHIMHMIYNFMRALIIWLNSIYKGGVSTVHLLPFFSLDTVILWKKVAMHCLHLGSGIMLCFLSTDSLYQLLKLFCK